MIMLQLSTENKITTKPCLTTTSAGEYLPADKPDRLDNKAFDDDYIRQYLRHPEKGKLAALRKANHPDPTRQKAWHLHHRLADKIDRELDKLIKQDAALGRATLVHLTKNAQSESVQAACAAKLMEYADKTKPQHVIHRMDTVEDLDAEIEQIQKRIAAGMNEAPAD